VTTGISAHALGSFMPGPRTASPTVNNEDTWAALVLRALVFDLKFFISLRILSHNGTPRSIVFALFQDTFLDLRLSICLPVPF
jgi:hypothetical protein